jgi:hypothetical protein
MRKSTAWQEVGVWTAEPIAGRIIRCGIHDARVGIDYIWREGGEARQGKRFQKPLNNLKHLGVRTR